METAGIYGLSKLLGHQCISLSAIIANRISGSFSGNPEATMDKLIKNVLLKISEQGHEV
jgi:uridine phosphorylase